MVLKAGNPRYPAEWLKHFLLEMDWLAADVVASESGAFEPAHCGACVHN